MSQLYKDYDDYMDGIEPDYDALDAQADAKLQAHKDTLSVYPEHIYQRVVDIFPTALAVEEAERYLKYEETNKELVKSIWGNI